VGETENLPGFYYAHVPSLGLTTHGSGGEGALAAARDLIHLWLDEKRAAGENPVPGRESLLATVEVD
jgi:predicted RNase H-like HicB family nuclease